MRELENNTNIFSNIFDRAEQNNILILDKDGIVKDINEAFTNNFGYKKRDIVGKNFSVLFTKEDIERELPQRELHSVLSQGQGSDNNYLLSKDGTKTWVSGESVLAKSSDTNVMITKIIQNIHIQKESEYALTQLHNFNEDILRSINDLVIVIHPDFSIVKHNDAFEQAFDINQNTFDLNFEKLAARFDKEDVLINSINDAFATGKPIVKILVEVILPELENRMFEVNGNLMLTPSGGQSLLLVLHDITMFKELERQKEDIIGFVAHELRNPLSSIGLSNELMGMLLKEKKYDEMEEMLQHSKNSVLRLNKMVAELYTATKVSAGTIALEMSTFNFKHLINEAVETTQLLQPSYNIIVEGNTDLIITADKYKLMEVVNNYLSNGIKYSNGATDVKLRILKAANMVVVSVKDNGLGVHPDQLPFIFERFFRAEKTRNLEGLGLGLYLCQRIIAAHGGRVWAQSEEGKGSVFYFSVPL